MTNLKNTKGALVSSVVALLICFSMLLGTTYAWFTDTVTSSGNILQSGNLQAAMYWANGADDITSANWNNVSADETNAIFTHTNWEPGYIDAKHIKVTNVGTLAFNYELRIVTNEVVGMLADVIDVYVINQNNGASVVDRNAIAGLEPVGTLSQVLLDSELITDKVTGSLTAPVGNEEVAEYWTIALKMQETANNDYQGKTLNNIKVELVATQMASEDDSFGNDYDNGALSGALPAARVTLLKDLDVSVGISSDYGDLAGNLTLDAGYQFEPTSTYEDALNSEYRYWHADFVVYANATVPADSLALAGYYAAFCDGFNDGNWVALSSPEDIAAGTQIRLVSSMAEGLFVNWEELCYYGNDGLGFQCGLVDLTGVNAGTTVTVELRLYETTGDPNTTTGSKNEETGEYITIATFTHTFPKTVDSTEGLADALAQGGTINLAAGEYKMPSNQSTTSTLNIVGTKDTVIDVTMGAYMDQATVTFTGVTIKTGTGYANGNGSDYAALYTPNVTYIDCTFEGPMRVGRDGAKFINCTFNSLGNDYVWTYGNDVTFEGCTFNTDGKAILIYSDGGNEVSQVTVKNCVFNSTTGAKAGAIANQNCAAIEIHNYGNGVNLVTEGNTYDANFSGEWRIKTYEAGKPQVFVNGVEYTTIALDGKTMTIDANKNVTVNN